MFHIYPAHIGVIHFLTPMQADFILECHRHWLGIDDRIPSFKVEDVEGQLDRFDVGDAVVLKIRIHKRDAVDGVLAGSHVARKNRFHHKAVDRHVARLNGDPATRIVLNVDHKLLPEP